MKEDNRQRVRLVNQQKYLRYEVVLKNGRVYCAECGSELVCIDCDNICDDCSKWSEPFNN